MPSCNPRRRKEAPNRARSVRKSDGSFTGGCSPVTSLSSKWLRVPAFPLSVIPGPDLTTTYGVGELILAAAKAGCKRIIVGLGGSATNDGGCGAAAACGVTFLDKEGNAFIPTGGTLNQVVSIDTSTRNPILDRVTITTMCDIDNPFYGETGAAYIFRTSEGCGP